MDELVHRWRQHKLTVIKDKERSPRVGLGNRFSEYKISRKKHGGLWILLLVRGSEKRVEGTIER